MNKKNIYIELDDNKIRKNLKVSDVIKVVEKGFIKKGQGLVNLPPKTGPKLSPAGTFADAQSAAIFNKNKKVELFGTKWLSVYPENKKKGIPYINALIILNDPKTGIPNAILNGGWITGIRTAAASAVCAKYFAPKKKKLIVGVFGLGLQAYVHVLAIREIYKNAEFIFYNHSDKSVKQFQKRFPNEKLITSKDCHEVVRSSDIVLTLTTFPKKIEPYVFEKDLKEDVLILPVDYGSRIEPKIYKKIDRIYTDDIAQYELKCKTTNYFPKPRPKISKEVGSMLLKPSSSKVKRGRTLVFNLGIGLFDVMVASHFVKKIS